MKQQYRSTIAVLSLLSLCVTFFCAAGAENNSTLSLEGAAINDSGFRPSVDGFSFQNYGDDPVTVDLTSAELQRMFGDKVCASNESGKCILTYPAERWMNQAIAAMKNGHCEGIAVLSSLMYYNETSPGIFGGSKVIDLSLKEVLLQREIGYWWTTQVTRPGGSKKVLDSPRAVLDALTAAFANGSSAGEWWVMGIYLPNGSGGHAITPYAVEDLGNGTARIMVYDNNWPKDSRFVEVDTINNSWRYLASANPDEPDSLYSGNASTKNLEIVSLSTRLGRQECDFCEEESTTGGSSGQQTGPGTKSIQIWQSGKARTLVTDDDGKRAGILDSGEMVNEIPGAEIRNLKFGLNGIGRSYPPVILLPLTLITDSQITIDINSTANGSEKNLANTTIIAPGFALASSIANLGRGQNQSMELFSENVAYNVSLSSSSQMSPTISIDTDLQRITLSGLVIDPSGRINISLDPSLGAFSMSTLGNLKPGTLQLLMTSLDPASGTTSTFKSLDLMLRTDDAISMDLSGGFGETGSPSIAVYRKNGGMQEMSLQTVSRNVPVEIPAGISLDMPEVADSGNLTRLNSTNSSSSLTAASSPASSASIPLSSPTSGGDMGGSSMSVPSIPSPTGMPSMGTPI
ncbi:MAG: hypothetical protein A4E49_03322 [Methanosaeta sp. PtaU1.Bin112]|nr:MAG: hypothetical protein A4E49_03322 [Methanosaeta sp. PtaU1.Bin112]